MHLYDSAHTDHRKQLEDFSAHYRADPVRKLATTALSKSEMSDVAYVSAGAAQMRHKFSIEIPTLAVTNQKNPAAAGCLLR